MTVPVLDYDPSKDAHDSYFVGVEAKRLRGDTSWPERPATKAPNWWLWVVLIACAVFWAGILILIVR